MDQVVDGSQCLLNRRLRVPRVAVEEIDAVGFQSLQRRFNGANDVIARRADIVDAIANLRAVFRRQYDLIAPACGTEEVADHPLGITDGVGIRRIDEVDARVKSLRHDLVRSRLIAAIGIAEIIRT